MKFTVLILTMLAINVIVNAQEKGDIAVGGYLAIGTGNNYTNGGIGAKFLYSATNRIRLAAEFDSWRKENLNMSVDNINLYRSAYNINAYAHFLPSNRDKKTVIYPFVGIGRESIKHSGFNTFNSHHIAFLFGGGIDFKLSSKFSLNSELRIHQVYIGAPKGSGSFLSGGSLNLAVGLAYKF